MSEFFASILQGINSVIHSWGWSMILFTLIVKIIVLPLDYKSRKSMRKTTALQPEIQKLQKKYANDQEKLNQKMSELYRKEGVSPMGGCLPMIISMVILWVMWSAMRSVANAKLAEQCFELLTKGVQSNESWLWIKNIWMPDSPFNSIMPNQSSLQMIQPATWLEAFNKFAADEASIELLAGMGITAETFTGTAATAGAAVLDALKVLPVYVQETALWSVMPSINVIIAQLNIYANNNGWFVLPILAAVTQLLMTNAQPQPAATDANNSQAASGKFMKYFFPIFSLWICSTYNALFSLYWVVSNLFAWIQSVVLNKVFDNMDAKEKSAKEIVKEGTLK